MTFGSLFAGIGGFDLGLERAGMECRWQVEIDPFCRKVLTKHWPEVPKYGDITKITGQELERVDLICGGFPCQPVSWGGNRLIVEDDRWLWPRFAQILGEMGPQFAILENVSGLLTGGGMDVVLGDLAQLGFDAVWRVFSVYEFGGWHERQRVFIVAHTPGVGREICDEFIRFDAEKSISQSGYWQNVLVPSRVQRVVDGVPVGLDRLASCGNAVVPQVAEWIGRQIMKAATDA